MLLYRYLSPLIPVTINTKMTSVPRTQSRVGDVSFRTGKKKWSVLGLCHYKGVDRDSHSLWYVDTLKCWYVLNTWVVSEYRMHLHDAPDVIGVIHGLGMSKPWAMGRKNVLTKGSDIVGVRSLTDSFVSVSLKLIWIPVLSLVLTLLPLLWFNRNIGDKGVEEISLQKNISKIWPEPLPAWALLA